MIVENIWRDATLYNGEWQQHPIDSYWIKATLADIPQLLILAGLDAEILQMDIEENQENGSFYLLVTKDGRSIMSFPSHYPGSGQWNGHSPFEAIDPIIIEHLSTLQDLDVPHSNEAPQDQ